MTMPATPNDIRASQGSSSQGTKISLGGDSVASVTARLLREPLLHFCVLGALIFGADAVLHPPAADNKDVLVTKALRQSFIDSFDEDKERVPTEAQLQQTIDNWVANEILFREGKALGVDRGDDMIRERITYKVQELIFEQIKVPRPTETELRTWFASNHKQFDEPERVGFYLTPPSDEATARRRLDDILAQREGEDLHEHTRIFPARPVESLTASFGDSFKDVLLALPMKEWHLIQSKEGWHVARLDSRRPGILVKFENVSDAVTKIWLADETRRRSQDAVARLKSGYRVKYEQ
jgi:hypothetical protein